MIVKSSRDAMSNLIIAYCITLIPCAAFILDGGVLPAVLLLFFSTIICVSSAVVIGRTLVFNEEGCSVKLGRYEKTYQ